LYLKQIGAAVVGQATAVAIVSERMFGAIWRQAHEHPQTGMDMKAKLLVIAVAAFAMSGVYAVSAQSPKSQWDGVYTTAQADRGKAVFDSRCQSCHLADLVGGEPEEGTPAPPLVGDDFEKQWDGHPLKELVDKIHADMPADEPGALTLQQSVDVLADILRRKKFEAGSSELPTDDAGLSGIRYRATK
jgi:S-disulfanyl-L-cysteine oxidoreductase SoxD